MTDCLIDLDDRRTVADRIEADLRRRAANTCPVVVTGLKRGAPDVEAQLLAEPARTWAEAMDKARFLLQRYLATPDAQDAGLQKLIRRALADLSRLKNHEKSGA